MKVIDFHTHPFEKFKNNICEYPEAIEKTEFFEMSKKLGFDKVCGSVIEREKYMEATWENILSLNNEMLRLWENNKDYYIPGFHIHPAFVRESCEEIERMHKLGIRLIGELVPYRHGWGYGDKGLDEILAVAEERGMVFSCHTVGDDEMDEMVKKHKNLKIVAAHPGKRVQFMRHMERMAYSENYFLDTAGMGIFRYGMLRYAINAYGAERIIFGTDYPICNPPMYIGAVRDDLLLTEDEKEKLLYKNAENLLIK